MNKGLLLRIVAIAVVLAVILVLLNYCGDLETRMNRWGSSLPVPYEEVLWLSNGGFQLRDNDRFIAAMQVPFGEIQFSPDTEYSLDTMQSGQRIITDEDVIAFGVSIAAMLPANEPLEEEAVVKAFRVARKCFDKAGIPVYFSEYYTVGYYFFHVFATREQIKSLTCDDSAALYIFLTRENWGVEDYYEK